MQILQCNGQDAERWSAFVRTLPVSRQDVHYLPEYAAIYTNSTPAASAFGGAGTACAAYWEGEHGAVLYPFLRRPVRVGDEQPCIDGFNIHELAGLYGMGGPLLSCAAGEEHSLYAEFDRHFQEWCGDERLASEFICPHLFTGSLTLLQANSTYQTVYTKVIVSVPLQDGDLWAACNKGRKYEINRSRRQGVTTARVTPTDSLHREFYHIYRTTMHRKHAAERWFVEESYFQDCLTCLGSDGVSFFAAHLNDTLCAWIMLLHHGETAYYHFAGVTPEGLNAGAPSLLLHSAAQWAQSAGYTRLYLGGGVTSAEDDSVFRFKHSFSRQTLPFYRAWRVLHADVYNQLCRLKIAHEQHTGYASSDEMFFPLYRR